MDGPESKDLWTVTGILSVIVGAVVTLVKVILPALRNGKHGPDHDRLMREIEKELDGLGNRLTAEIKEAAQAIVAHVDLNARERDVERRESKKQA